jgi:hypothetical protein
MEPKGFASYILTGSIAFTALVAVFMMLIAYVGGSSGVMEPSAKRLFTVLIILFFITSVVVVGIILFPDLLKSAFYSINRLGYR